MITLRTVILLLLLGMLSPLVPNPSGIASASDCDTGCDEYGCCLTACVSVVDGVIYIDYWYSGNCGGSGGGGGGAGENGACFSINHQRYICNVMPKLGTCGEGPGRCDTNYFFFYLCSGTGQIECDGRHSGARSTCNSAHWCLGAWCVYGIDENDCDCTVNAGCYCSVLS
jgi:hypothetical protein